MENCIPEFWEREREWKIAFPTFGNGNGNEKLIPKLWERESEARIPENGREREFPLTPGLCLYQQNISRSTSFLKVREQQALATLASQSERLVGGH